MRAQIIDPADPTLYDCSARDCIPYNGNGGDICVKVLARDPMHAYLWDRQLIR